MSDLHCDKLKPLQVIFSSIVLNCIFFVASANSQIDFDSAYQSTQSKNKNLSNVEIFENLKLAINSKSLTSQECLKFKVLMQNGYSPAIKVALKNYKKGEILGGQYNPESSLGCNLTTLGNIFANAADTNSDLKNDGSYLFDLAKYESQKGTSRGRDELLNMSNRASKFLIRSAETGYTEANFILGKQYSATYDKIIKQCGQPCYPAQTEQKLESLRKSGFKYLLKAAELGSVKSETILLDIYGFDYQEQKGRHQLATLKSPSRPIETNPTEIKEPAPSIKLNDSNIASSSNSEIEENASHRENLKTQDEPYFSLYVVPNTLNERTSPSGDVVSRVQRGDILKIYGSSGDWYRVTPKYASPRYVHSDYLSKSKPVSQANQSIAKSKPRDFVVVKRRRGTLRMCRQFIADSVENPAEIDIRYATEKSIIAQFKADNYTYRVSCDGFNITLARK